MFEISETKHDKILMTKPGLALPNLANAHPVYTGSNSLSPFHLPALMRTIMAKHVVSGPEDETRQRLKVGSGKTRNLMITIRVEK